jgi:bifunctional non-homologous end joining protein LigD
MLWDRGTWTPQEDPHEGLEKGALKFNLHGKPLKGGFALVRLPPRNKESRENWLLVKERDGMAGGPDPVREWTKSVTTGRMFDEIAAAQNVPHSSSKERRRRAAAKKPILQRKKAVLPLPAFRAPQLATLALRPPSGDQWVHEIKFDGYRIMAATAGGQTRLYTRSGLDWTNKFGGLSEAIAQLPARSALIDGEVVVVDENGRSDFGRLQQALKTSDEPLRFYAFDLLELDGEDISRLNLGERKTRLSAMLREAPGRVLYSDHITGDGEKVLSKCCGMGLEGIVSKRIDKPYASRRTPFWIKTKCTGRDEFVIGGWCPSNGMDGSPFHPQAESLQLEGELS